MKSLQLLVYKPEEGAIQARDSVQVLRICNPFRCIAYCREQLFVR